MEKYTSEVEEKMRAFYQNLAEKDKRYYSAIEAMKLKYGGIKYIANLFKCSRQTIYTGIKELAENKLLPSGQSRVAGGGRKSRATKTPEINEVFLKCS